MYKSIKNLWKISRCFYETFFWQLLNIFKCFAWIEFLFNYIQFYAVHFTSECPSEALYIYIHRYIFVYVYEPTQVQVKFHFFEMFSFCGTLVFCNYAKYKKTLVAKNINIYGYISHIAIMRIVRNKNQTAIEPNGRHSHLRFAKWSLSQIRHWN